MEKVIREKWNTILEFMKTEYNITEVAYKTWLLPLSVHSVENDTIIISVDDSKTGALSLDFVRNKYGVFLKTAVAEILNKEYDIHYILSSNAPAMTQNTKPKNESYSNLNPKYTFDTFVIGSNNQFAHAASLAVAEDPGGAYNPLFIYGGVGLGKTHLMHSIAHFILEQNPEARVMYVTCETFANELIQSIRNKTTMDFKDKYRNIDVLLIDDIQFISGKESTQEEFFHTFNALHGLKKQIIISSDRPPKDIQTLESRLRSRFEMGLIADIQSPDYETRMAILNKKIETDHIFIEPAILEFIASNIKSNIRELEGSLNKIIALSRLKKQEINMSLVTEAIQDYINDDNPHTITLAYIVDIVADHYGLTPQEIYSKNRSRKIAYPRQIAIYLCRKFLSMSLTDIGRSIGDRDHSTVIHSCRTIEDDLKDDISLQNTIDVLTKKINPQ
ncbi:MAG: chromosomal replication initiator protein DnaA [Lachnospiraceae bacterium]|nr:chromosomal replication initiator protein DnaA [Lachnospiraceae bacterium]